MGILCPMCIGDEVMKKIGQTNWEMELHDVYKCDCCSSKLLLPTEEID